MAVVAFILGWLAGLGAAAQVSLAAHVWALAGLLASVLTFLARRTRAFLVFVALAGALWGAARYQLSQREPGPGHVVHYNDVGEVALYGQIVAPPRVYDRSIRAVLEVSTLASPPGSSPSPAGGLVQLTAPRFAGLQYGAWLTATGRLETPRNEGDFDYRAYLARREIYSELPFPALEEAAGPAPHPLYHALYRLRDRAGAVLQKLLPEPQAALLRGILLGDDSGLPVPLDAAFRLSATSHIIAISGFNIALLAGLLLRLAVPLAGPRWTVWIAVVTIALYTLLVGADPSVVRAAIMGGITLFAGRWLGRTLYAYASLCLAAFAMTLLRPAALWDAGFQLSFAATLGILLYVEPLSRRVLAVLGRWTDEGRARRLARLLADGLLVTLAAQLLTLPLLLYHFRQLSLVSPLANLLILPAQPGIMIWGGLATAAGLLWLPLGRLLVLPAWFFLTYTIAVVEWFAALPFAAIRVTLAPAGVAASYALIALLTWTAIRGPRRVFAVARRQAPALALTASLVLALFVWQWAETRPDGRLHVSFLDVGQGDATLIRTPNGRRILVDGGQHPSLLNSHLGRLLPYASRRLDLVVATHPDTDHVAGLPELFDRYRVERLLTNGALADGHPAYAALLEAATREEVPVLAGQTGQVIHLDEGVEMQVLYCGEAGSSDNDSSLALRLTYGDFSLLLTGDGELAAEEAMVSGSLPLTSTVWKAGHHGARTSGNAFFLEAVRPQVVVISCGEGNSSGHPHPELLQRVAGVGAAALRTDELGTIELITDGRQIWWEAER